MPPVYRYDRAQRTITETRAPEGADGMSALADVLAERQRCAEVIAELVRTAEDTIAAQAVTGIAVTEATVAGDVATVTVSVPEPSPQAPMEAVLTALQRLADAFRNHAVALTGVMPRLRTTAQPRDAADALVHGCTCSTCMAARGAAQGSGWNSAEDPHRLARYQRDGTYAAPPDTAVDLAPLLRLLTPEQAARFVAERWCDVAGSTGRRYRVRYEPSGNVYRHDDGARLCLAHPSRWASMGAMLACQVFLLTRDEAEFLRRANVLGYVTYLPHPDRPCPEYSLGPYSLGPLGGPDTPAPVTPTTFANWAARMTEAAPYDAAVRVTPEEVATALGAERHPDGSPRRRRRP